MLLTMREKTRIEAVQAVMDGRLTVAQAATALNLSERQVYRALAAARDEGLVGLVHGNRGRTPWNKYDEALWKSVLRLVRQRYTDVNDCHLQELLERDHSIHLHPEALRRHLRAAGLAPKKPTRRKRRGGSKDSGASSRTGSSSSCALRVHARSKKLTVYSKPSCPATISASRSRRANRRRCGASHRRRINSTASCV
jgi:transposase